MKIRENLGREQLWLVSAVIKWSCLALLTGILAGCAASFFIRALHYCSALAAGLGERKAYLIFPGLFVSYMLVRVYTRDAKVDVVEAIHNDFGAIDLKAVPLRLLSTIVTISCGGATGKESPCASIGAGVMYSVSRLFKLDERDTKKLATIGSAAGISAVFGTPIAGAVFGIEILYMGELMYDVLLPAFVASTVSSTVSKLLFVRGLTSVPVRIPALSHAPIIWSVAGGIFFGFIALAHIEAINFSHKTFRSMKIPRKLKPLLGAAILFAMFHFFGDFYSGLNNELVVAALYSAPVPDLAFVLKSLALAVTLGCGGSGGVIMPTMFVGATAGSFFAAQLGLEMSSMSAIGFVALLAGATSTPIASTILAMELFGAEIAPFAGIACVTAYIVAGHRSLYSGQVMRRPKTELFVHRTDAEGHEEIVERFEDISYRKLLKFRYREAKKKFKGKKKRK